mmetsp:Transcript_12550/g.30320  ORF Transcript_12550/g.30320 Transcript_12550/m.30320 type:complete len:116 (-) Transcript_12550:45-392(-)
MEFQTASSCSSSSCSSDDDGDASATDENPTDGRDSGEEYFVAIIDRDNFGDTFICDDANDENPLQAPVRRRQQKWSRGTTSNLDVAAVVDPTLHLFSSGQDNALCRGFRRRNIAI